MKAESRKSRTVAWSQWVYQRLLAAYPRRHRAEYGAAMAQLFRDQCRDAWQWRRGWGLALLWLRTLPELARTSLWERLTSTKERESMFKKMIGGNGAQPGLIGVFIAVFMAVFLLVVLTSTIITFILPEAYASTARIKVERSMTATPVNGVPMKSPQPTGVYDPYAIQTEFEVIQSEIILDRVIERLDLNTVWQKKYSLAARLKKSESCAMLKRMIELRPLRNTSLIDIKVYSDDRLEASKIANTVAEAYQDYKHEQQQKLLAGAEETRKKLREEVKNDLAENPKDAKSEDAKIDQIITKAAQLDQASTAGTQIERVEIIDHAEPGFRPVRPNKPLNIFLGGVAGTFLGVVIGGGAVLLMWRARSKAPVVASRPA